MTVALVVLVLLSVVVNASSNSCNTRAFRDGIVCVCNSTYCDTVERFGVLGSGEYKLYSSSKSNLGFNVQSGYFSETKNSSAITIKVNGNIKYQKIIGFGGAFTDATGININSLPKAAQQKLLESYFSYNGIEYSLCRVPIGGADFSPRPYSYDDHENDTTLEYFQLQEEDLLYKIPFIKEAINLKSEDVLNLFASAWTAPPWMKTNNLWTGYGFLKKQYYQLWADYMVKFFNEYEKEDITFWGLTTGNEPANGFKSEIINDMAWVPFQQNKWIKENLGPTIRDSSHNNLKIMLFDDNRFTLPYSVPFYLNDVETLQYADGVAVHWYEDDMVPADVLNLAESNLKDIFLLASEACFFRQGVLLGSWDRAAKYLNSIFEYLEHGAVGWIDWNMALNLTGGPTYVGSVADSPIIVNATGQEFYKQPMFYAIGHFSKFVMSNSVRLGISYDFSQGSAATDSNIKALAFSRPDDITAVIIFNNNNSSLSIQLEDSNLYSDIVDVEANSVYTFLYITGVTARHIAAKLA